MSFIDLPVPHGRLEALWWKVDAPRGAAVVCHPHPLHGGTMHNHLTYRTAQAFRDEGISALRFNFRGVGRSTGTHDEGLGELEDAAAALDFVAREQPGAPLYLAGFSFGARTALQLAVRDQRVAKVLGVGLTVDLYDFEFLRALALPKAFIQADNDEFGALPKVRALVEALPPPSKLFVVPGADHLATQRLKEFEEQARAAVQWLVAQ